MRTWSSTRSRTLSADEGRNPVQGDGHVYSPNRQARDHVIAGFAGDDRALQARVLVADHDGHTREHAAGGVADGAEDAARLSPVCAARDLPARTARADGDGGHGVSPCRRDRYHDGDSSVMLVPGLDCRSSERTVGSRLRSGNHAGREPTRAARRCSRLASPGALARRASAWDAARGSRRSRPAA